MDSRCRPATTANQNCLASRSCLPANHPASHYHRNQQYSISALTNGSGTITERYAYSAYGTPTIADGSGTELTSSADNNRYTYTGREWDSNLSLYHYRARMYDSVAGRFCSRDPIGYGDGENLYGLYIGLALLDHSGTSVFPCKQSRNGFKIEALNKAEQIANFSQKLGRFAPIKLSLTTRGFCDTRTCPQKCDCDRTVDLVTEDCHLGGELGFSTKGVPLGTLPADISIYGSVRFTVSKNSTFGGCHNVDESSVCFNYTGTVGVKVCAKTPNESLFKGCVNVRLTCNNSYCINPPYDTGAGSGCAISVNAEGCVGWWCSEAKLWESEEFGVW